MFGELFDKIEEQEDIAICKEPFCSLIKNTWKMEIKRRLLIIKSDITTWGIKGLFCEPKSFEKDGYPILGLRKWNKIFILKKENFILSFDSKILEELKKKQWR